MNTTTTTDESTPEARQQLRRELLANLEWQQVEEFSVARAYLIQVVRERIWEAAKC